MCITNTSSKCHPARKEHPTQEEISNECIQPVEEMRHEEGHYVISNVASSSIQHISADLQKIRMKMEEDEVMEDLRQQWKLAARILDRMFLVV